MLMSAADPVVLAFALGDTAWRGRALSSTFSWPLGIRSKVDWPELGAGSAPEVTLEGSARRASRTMYWCGGHAFGASLG